MKEEKLLVLAKACPVVSKKYKELICVAGLVSEKDWRRVYPIPWECFWTSSKNYFKKKSWVQYSMEEDKPSDHRPESRKILSSTIKSIKEEDYHKIRELLEKNLTTLEELKEKGHKKVSLGVIKPIITDFVEESNESYEKLMDKKKQQTLFGSGSAVRIDIPEKKYSYKFKCGHKNCKGHKLLCEDWEIGELYRHCEDYKRLGKYKDEKEVFEKIKYKMFDFMLKKREVYFIVGSHYRFNTYMIIGIIYPKKADESKLKKLGI